MPGEPIVSDPPRGRVDVPGPDGLKLAELEAQPPWTPRADRRGSGEKFAAGLRGIEACDSGRLELLRPDAYRGTLIAITAALLSVDALRRRAFC